MVSKKTSRSLKSASPAQPLEEKKKKPSQAAAKPAVRAATGRKRRAAAPSAAPVSPMVEASDEDIRIRAYFLSLEYRGSGRRDVDFWLLAERELRPAKTSGKP